MRVSITSVIPIDDWMYFNHGTYGCGEGRKKYGPKYIF